MHPGKRPADRLIRSCTSRAGTIAGSADYESAPRPLHTVALGLGADPIGMVRNSRQRHFAHGAKSRCRKHVMHEKPVGAPVVCQRRIREPPRPCSGPHLASSTHCSSSASVINEMSSWRRCQLRRVSCGTITLPVTSPLMKCREELFDGLLFRPKVAQEFARVRGEMVPCSATSS